MASPFPSWCPIPVGGIVQGVSGPISAGLRQLELFIGLGHIHGDFARSGHAAHSMHYCGLAADIDALKYLWDWLFPVNRELILLLGPWGLYNYGVRYYNQAEQDAHMTHIHVALNKTADGVSTLWPKLPNGKRHVPGGAHPAPAPKAPPVSQVPGLEASWHHLRDSLSKDVPKSVNRIVRARVKLHNTLT